MNKKIITLVAFLLTFALCACELPVPMHEVDVTPVSFEALTYSEAVADFAAEPVKQYDVAQITFDNSLIYDETNLALLNLYEEQKSIEIEKQASKKKKEKKQDSGNNNSNNNTYREEYDYNYDYNNYDYGDYDYSTETGDGSDSSSQGGGYAFDETEVEIYVPPSADGFADQVVALVNAERAKAGLGSLSTTPELIQAAEKRANENVSVYSHTRPDGSRCFTVFGEYGISYHKAAENIAAGYGSPESVMNGWMNSSGHKANILTAEFSHIGVGVVYADDSEYGFYWVQLFTD